MPLRNADGTPLTNVAAGDLITVEFYGVNDPDDGAGHDADPFKPMIPESQISILDYAIMAADMNRGYYETLLPYAKTYFICRNLSVTNYSITNAAGIRKNAPPQPTYCSHSMQAEDLARFLKNFGGFN